MRHKTIYVDFKNKKAIGVQEIEFLTVSNQIMTGVKNIFRLAKHSFVQKNDEPAAFALNEVDAAMNNLKAAYKALDQAMIAAGHFEIANYNPKDRQFAEEVVDAASQLRALNLELSDSLMFFDEILRDKYGILIKK